MSLTIEGGNPIRVTGTTNTAEVVSAPAKALVRIKSVYWFNPTTAGDLCTLKDVDGNYILELRCETNGVSQQWDVDSAFASIYCDDMDSGTLYIFTN